MHIHTYIRIHICAQPAASVFAHVYVGVKNAPVGVWKAMRRGSAEEEVRKHRDRVTRAWKQIRKQRQQVDIRYDPSIVTALQHGT